MEIEAPAIGGSHDKRLLKASVGIGMTACVRALNPGRLDHVISGQVYKAVYTELYKLETLAYGNTDATVSEWKFFVHESLTTDRAYAMIMESYAR